MMPVLPYLPDMNIVELYKRHGQPGQFKTEPDRLAWGQARETEGWTRNEIAYCLGITTQKYNQMRHYADKPRVQAAKA